MYGDCNTGEVKRNLVTITWLAEILGQAGPGDTGQAASPSDSSEVSAEIDCARSGAACRGFSDRRCAVHVAPSPIPAG